VTVDNGFFTVKFHAMGESFAKWPVHRDCTADDVYTPLALKELRRRLAEQANAAVEAR
jgi:hypothetical protein